jgi:hypothetical protein
LAALIAAKTFPEYEPAVWSAGGAALLGLLYVELKKPVNYRSLEIDGNGFHYDGATGEINHVQWGDVCDVYFLRLYNFFANQMDTEWEIHTTKAVRPVRVTIEWPHRKKLASALEANVPGFLAAAANAASRSKEEGRWHCFRGADPSIEPTASGKAGA